MKYFKPLLVLAGFMIVLCVTACRHDPITPLSDAPTISFKNDVQPIMISNCTQSGCHGSEGHEFKLLTYQDVLGHVKAGEPHSSSIYSAITANTLGTMPQPPNPRLTDTQIKTIYLWILQGAKNN
ncbi:hypothetical protein MUY27_15165 [Mucilaginibacter sp. RS28]|uniref:Cytochrome C Planctomycete-type domain-containing protein n=1 Tax=Mucilaginibacter straminoryzae TaxID=2932774 RepID=A0A9X1X4H4_9SPHI|nr:hypothetical protein [Mucilaginibacter straminoryzae]MCJ8211057.1 hypothetical protein [Mucilaginibacter straminoryzae]